MAYQVLARKFRPQSFDDVVGQTHVTRTLRNAIQMERIHHAFLFTGTRGCGKTSTARILAKALNCKNASKDLDPCNQCDSCKEITAGSSLDVLEIDGASNNGVDAIRELRENVRFMPSKGRFKIYIVDEVHMLSNAAFNALLKTLEEPPAHVIFIFATTEPHSLPQTILSRCQRFDFKRIPPKRIAERLSQIAKAEGIEIGPAGLAALSRAAEGSMRDAQSLFDQVISFAGKDEKSGNTVITDAQITESLGLIDRQLFTDLLQALGARDGKAALDVAQRVATAGYEVTHFGREALARIRDLMVVKVVSDDPARLVDLSGEELDLLKSLATKFTREEIDSLFLMLEHALEEMVRGDTPQLALEMAVLRMAAVEPIAPIAELVSRVESLASGAPVAPSSSRSAPSGGKPAGFKGWQPPDERPANRAAKAESPDSSAKSADGGAPMGAVVTKSAPAPVVEIEKPERTVTATIEAPIFDWDGFVSYVKNRKPLLGRLISDGQLSRFDGEELRIGYDTTGVSAERVRDQDSIDQIATLARDFLKRQIAVKIVSMTSPSSSSAPSSGAPRPADAPPKRNVMEERAKLREEALANDAIKSAMDVLGAELAEVKPTTRST